MEKTDLLEIKKLFRYPDCSFGKMGFAVMSSLEYEGQDPAERIEYTGETLFLTRDDEEQKSFLSLLQKAFCFQEGVSSLDMEVTGDLKRLLSSYAFTEKTSDHSFISFARLVAEKYDNPKSYALVFFLGGYDIPIKDESKTKTGESDEVYNYVAIMLCPIEASKVGLSPIEGDIKRGDIVKILKAPTFGLLYPSFTNRESDDNTAFVCCKKESERGLAESLFDASVPEPVKKEKATVKVPVDAGSGYLDTPAAEQVENIDMPPRDAPQSSEGGYTVHEESHIGSRHDDEGYSNVNDIDSALLKKRESSYDDEEEFTQDIEVKEDKSVVSNDKVTERDIGGKKFFIIPRDLLPDDILEKILSLGL